MLVKRARLSINRKYLGGFLLLSAISVICVAFSLASDEIDVARREILLRRVGHEILLQSGDSTSRVLPVKKIGDNEYRVSFEKAFTFSPDSLVNTTRRLFANDPLTGDYVVDVVNCADSSVAYGYAISGDKKDDIIACLGRVQPKGCYYLRIRFRSAETGIGKDGYLLGSLALLAVSGYVFWRRAKPVTASSQNESPVVTDQPAETQQPSSSQFALGSLLFDAETRRLLRDGQTIDLTKTEARVLRIFAASPNEVIERSRLQKEIWEDEGVIVGRSLDMFISKLRKKLELDPDTRIVVIRGKGYKLQVNTQESPGSC